MQTAQLTGRNERPKGRAENTILDAAVLSKKLIAVCAIFPGKYNPRPKVSVEDRVCI